MIVTIIVLYFVVSVVLSVIATYVQYKVDYSYEDLDRFFEYDFKCSVCVLIWVFWPITLVIIFLAYGVPSFYKSACILLDRFFGGGKDD